MFRPSLPVIGVFFGAIGLIGFCGVLRAEITTDSPAATQALPPWAQPEVLDAARAIQMTDEQLPMFRAAMTEMVNGRNRAINRLARGHNVTGLERKVKRATNRQFKKMDASMASFLSVGQFARYEAYRDLLRKGLNTRGRNFGGNSGQEKSIQSSGLFGGATSH